METVTGDRRALIMELWEGPRNRRNRRPADPRHSVGRKVRGGGLNGAAR